MHVSYFSLASGAFWSPFRKQEQTFFSSNSPSLSSMQALSLETASHSAVKRNMTLELALGLGGLPIEAASPLGPQPTKKQLKAQRRKALREADLLRAAGFEDRAGALEAAAGPGPRSPVPKSFLEKAARSHRRWTEAPASPPQSRTGFGAFEQHTTGVGSRIMRQWGFQGEGHGIGCQGEGLAEPIQVFRRAKNLGLGAASP